MNLYILLFIVISIYSANEWANIKYINNKIQQTKNELKQEINKKQIQTNDGTKI